MPRANSHLVELMLDICCLQREREREREREKEKKEEETFPDTLKDFVTNFKKTFSSFVSGQVRVREKAWGVQRRRRSVAEKCMHKLSTHV